MKRFSYFSVILTIFLFQEIAKAHPLFQANKHHEPSHKKDVLLPESSSSQDPFESITKMGDQILKDFRNFEFFDEDFFSGTQSSFSHLASGPKSYKLKSRETSDVLIYEIELNSQVEGDSVNVAVENGMVTISGEQKRLSESDLKKGQGYFSSSSTFSQSFSVPPHVDSENVVVTNENSTIILTFPKGNKEV